MVGVWQYNEGLASYLTGLPLNENELKEVFSEKIVVLQDGRWWLAGYVSYQYGDIRKSQATNKPHQKYIQMLKNHGLWEMFIDYIEGYHDRLSVLKGGGGNNDPGKECHGSHKEEETEGEEAIPQEGEIEREGATEKKEAPSPSLSEKKKEGEQAEMELDIEMRGKPHWKEDFENEACPY